MQPKPRVLLIHNIIAPYRVPLFRALAEHPDIDLTVWFMSRSAKNRLWQPSSNGLGFSYQVLPKIEFNYFSRDLFTYVVNPTFPWQYASQSFDVLISAGWLDFASQAGFFLSKALGRKFVLWSESTAYEPSWRRTVAQPLVKTIVQGSDACVAVGTRSKEYLLALGASEPKVFTAFSTVDVRHFREVSSQARQRREALRAELGLPSGRVILYSGQFIERKGVKYLIEAFARVKSRHPDLALALLGYGPQKDELVSAARDLELRDVYFVDHVETSEIPKVYAAADLFVLPSLEETWGLVVNEAMACGLPVIATDRVGSSVDLIQDGLNGYIVLSANVDLLADRIDCLMSDEARLRRFAAQSRARVENFTPEAAAQGFAAAVAHALRPG